MGTTEPTTDTDTDDDDLTRKKKARIPLRAVRIPDDLWEQAQEACTYREDPSVSAVIRRSLANYVASTNRKRRKETEA